jgi:hypothetical protein
LWPIRTKNDRVSSPASLFSNGKHRESKRFELKYPPQAVLQECAVTRWQGTGDFIGRNRDSRKEAARAGIDQCAQTID